MARTNRPASRDPIYTHEGARAVHINPTQQLRRLVMAHMLWEDQFYIDGKTAAEQVAEAIKQVDPDVVAALAIEAREQQKLRHIPLFMCRVMAALPTHRGVVAETLARVIQRPDELTEYVALYWKEKRQTLSAQSKKGLAAAFQKFDEYQLAKYNRDDKVKLRDVLFLSHATPKDQAQAEVWKRLVNKELKTPDTWEVSLSGGAGKKETFERLIAEKKLGGLALLRNLRNMHDAGVSKSTISDALQSANLARVLPFRFIAAARAVPKLEDVIEIAMFRALENYPRLSGKTVLVVDVSGSMFHAGNVSPRSDISRVDAACALAALARETCDEVAVYATAGNDGTQVHKTRIVPARRGFALIDAIEKDMAKALGGGGIFLRQCLDYIYDREREADRLIVITDEVDCDRKLTPATANAFGKRNYLINIASYKNGIGYGKFTHVDGWSEAVLDFIREDEVSDQLDTPQRVA
jgi:TROVE domain-containing protein